MRISDWSSDVCSSDLQRYSRSRRAPGKEDEGQLEDAHAVEAAQQRRPFGPLSEVSPQHQIEQGAAHQGGKAHQQGNGDAVTDTQAVGRNFRPNHRANGGAEEQSGGSRWETSEQEAGAAEKGNGHTHPTWKRRQLETTNQ